MTHLNATIRVKDFTQMINCVGCLVSEARINITEDNINIKAVDVANVCMVDTMLDSKAFMKYDVDEEPFMLGINIDNMGFLKLLKADDYLSINYDEEDKDGRVNYKSGRFEYSIATISVDTIRKAPKVPDVQYKQEISILGEDIKTVVKANQKISETLTFELKNNNFIMSGKGMQSNMNYKISTDDLEQCAGEIDMNTFCMFDMDYITDIVNVMSGSDVIKMKLKTNYPMIMNWTFADGNGSVMYLLAPRIEDNY